MRRRLGKTAIFVTHDVREALLVATRIALLHNGRLAVLFSRTGYKNAWGMWPWVSPSQGGPYDHARQLHFAINISLLNTVVDD